LKRKILFGTILLILIAIVGLVLTHSAKVVEVAEVERAEISQNVEEIAYVQSAEDVQLEAPTNGKVTLVKTQIGDLVQKGQQLISIENLDLNAEVQSAKTQLAQAQAALAAAEISFRSANQELATAQRDLQRKEQLQQSGALPRVDYEEAQAYVENLQQMAASQQAYVGSVRGQVESSNKVLAQLGVKQAEMTIISPIDGVVFDLHAKPGEVVSPGQVLAQVGKADQLELKADLLSDDLRDVRVGQRVMISAPLLGDEVLWGQVEKIRPQAFTKVSALGVEQRRVEVIVSMEETANLQPGYEVQASIETQLKKNVLTIPRESLRSNAAGGYEVLLVKNGTVVHQTVKAGIKAPEIVEILNGLTEGDRIVRDGTLELKEGQKIKPQLAKG